MPDADTIERVKSRKVQVASLPPADSGRGFARLSDVLMAELGLNEGDVIEIVGKRSTAARAVRPYGEDEGIDIIRLDGLQRANAGVGSGDFVEIKKAESKPATRVVFAPAQHNVRLQGSADALKRSFAGRPLVEGDVVATAGHQRINADMPDQIRQMLNAPAFALQEVRLVVVSTVPKGIVHIDGKTEVELLPEYKEERESAAPTSPMTTSAACATRSMRCAKWSSCRCAIPSCSSASASIRPRACCFTARPAPARPGSPGRSRMKATRNSSTSPVPRSWARPMARARSRLREIFEQAAQAAPSIIFIDEIDFDRAQARPGDGRGREAPRRPAADPDGRAGAAAEYWS